MVPLLGLSWSSALHAADDAAADAAPKADDTEALAKQAQNPIANLISLPFQNNTTFDYGPRHRTQNILNIQPVLPFTLNEDWNLITRWILPIVHQPSLAKGDSSDTGTGNLNPTLFLSTSLAKDRLIGFGPTFLLPTASSNELGTEKWGAGPSAVVVWTPGHWLVGTLVNNIWSFAGPDRNQSTVNQFLAQPFVNYNLSDGWYLVSAPIITANWEADRSADTWTVPIGGGVGKLSRIDPLPPINAQVEVFRLAEAPRGFKWPRFAWRGWVGCWPLLSHCRVRRSRRSKRERLPAPVFRLRRRATRDR